MTIDKTYSPADIEARWYPHWEGSGAFHPARPDAEPFTIVIPPPNVTGSLHIGHALDNTLQDVLIRYHRLKGRDALWVVGTDHAGIATQQVVERTIAGQGLTRQSMGREAFVKTVWDWKEQSGGTITRQNVIGTWTGTSLPDEWIVVGAHYDSRNGSGSSVTNTPGAEDNASGCAGVSGGTSRSWASACCSSCWRGTWSGCGRRRRRWPCPSSLPCCHRSP